MNKTQTQQNGWREVKLGDVVLKVIDNRGKTPPLSNSGYELLEVNAISNNFKLPVYSNVRKFVSKETYNTWFRAGHPHKNDILIPTVGTIGNVAILKEDRGSIAQNLIALRINNESSSDYIYYYLQSPLGKNNVMSLDIGGVQPSVKVPHLLNSKIYLPPLPEQKAITEVLSSLDDKIDLLHRQNKTLEDMAQAVFRKWFVEGVKEDWDLVKLDKLVDTVNGYSYKGKELTENSNKALVTLKNFGRDGSFQNRGFKPFVGSPKKEQGVVIGDLVVAHTDLTQNADVLGNPALVFETGGFEKLYITMDVVKVIPKTKQFPKSLLYFLMKTKEFKGHCVGYSNGSTVLHLSKKAIPEFEILLPERQHLISEKVPFFDGVIDKITSNQSQIRTLENLRDTLLPKLMSGTVRVKFN